MLARARDERETALPPGRWTGGSIRFFDSTPRTVEIADLAARIDHDDRKPLPRWIASQQKYARLEAAHLLSTPGRFLRLTDRIRRVGWAAPLLVFFYALVVKRCLFDGLPGLMYVMQRTFAEVLVSLELLNRRLKRLDGDKAL